MKRLFILASVMGITLFGCVVDESKNEPGKGSGSIGGTVTSEDNQPISGAVVMLFDYSQSNRYMDCGAAVNGLAKNLIACIPEASAMDTTDANGAYRFNGLDAGTYYVNAIKSGFLSIGRIDSLQAGKMLSIDISLPKDETNSISCMREVELDCVTGFVDACLLNVDAEYHQCVTDTTVIRCYTKDQCGEGFECSIFTSASSALRLVEAPILTDSTSGAPAYDPAPYGYCIPIQDTTITILPVDSVVDCQNNAQCGDGKHCDWNYYAGTAIDSVNASGVTNSLMEKIQTTGVCMDGAPESLVCTKEFIPVCGVDGVTYSNSCMAFASGSQVAASGECQ